MLARGVARRALYVEAGLGDDLDYQDISGIRTCSCKGIGEREVILPHSGWEARKQNIGEVVAGRRRYGEAVHSAFALQAAAR